MKTCSRCNIEKPKTEFGPAKRYAEGLYCWCRPCVCEDKRARYAENPEKFRALASQYAKVNPDQCRATSAAYKKANPEKCRQWDRDRYQRDKVKRMAYVTQWAEKNPGLRKRYCKKWDDENPDKKRAAVRKRQAIKRKAIPAWADVAKMEAFYAEALRLERETGRVYHVDHIVPLQSHLVCGLHVETNLQILAQAANIRKGNRYWPDMPEEIHG